MPYAFTIWYCVVLIEYPIDKELKQVVQVLFSVNTPFDSPDNSTPVLEPKPNLFKNNSTSFIFPSLTILTVPTFDDLSIISFTERLIGSCLRKSLKHPL